MSRLRAMLERLSDLEATFAKVERVSGGSDSIAVRMSLRSLEERRNDLREELAAITSKEFVDVCDYRIIPDTEESYAISAVSGAWQGFQDLLSLTFGASEAGHPLKTSKLSADVTENTRLNFGYAYAGSLGIVLTIKNDRLLLVESELDKAVSAVFGFLKAQTVDEVKAIAHTYGLPVVRKLHDWAKVQSRNGISANVKWLRDGKVTHEVLVQPPEMAALCEVIASRQDEVVEPLEIVADLTRYDVTGKLFTLELPDEVTIRGKFAEGYVATPKLVRNRYRARVEKRTILHYATEEPDEHWFLNSLVEVERTA